MATVSRLRTRPVPAKPYSQGTMIIWSGGLPTARATATPPVNEFCCRARALRFLWRRSKLRIRSLSVRGSLRFTGIRAAGQARRVYRGDPCRTTVNCNPNCNPEDRWSQWGQAVGACRVPRSTLDSSRLP
jgi:hypothetical protein